MSSSENENGSDDEEQYYDSSSENGSDGSPQVKHSYESSNEGENDEESSGNLNGSQSKSSDEDDEDEETSKLISIALRIANGEELSSDDYSYVQEAADHLEHDDQQRRFKYILCANAAQHCGFVEPTYFNNLADLLSTKNVIMRQCIMWSFASILPCKNVLSPLLIRLLFKSLKDPTLGWSVAYLFRKISEYEKYSRMVRYLIWISMSNLICDRTLSEQVRMTLIYTLNNVFKLSKWLAPLIKHRFEDIIRTDGIETRVLVAAVQSLHSMVINGSQLDSSTINRLRMLSHSGDYSSMESIRDLIDFIDNKRILSNVSNSMLGGNVKKELTATQTTSVSRSQEETKEPTAQFQSMDHLMNTIGHLGRSFNAESKPIVVEQGDNQAWYRTTWNEVANLAAVAKKGQLKTQDFDYLVSKFADGLHWGVVPWTSRVEIYEMIAVAMKDAAEQNQEMKSNVIDTMINRLSGTNAKIHRNCAEALLLLMKNRQSLSSEQMEKIEKHLAEASDTIVKQHLIELYALYVLKGHPLTLDLDSISEDLLNETTCETTSYLFFKAASLNKKAFSNEILSKLSRVAQLSSFNLKSRENCVWAMAYSIESTTKKQSISNEIIEQLGDLLIRTEKNLRQASAIALCYYGIDESTELSSTIVERLADLLKDSDESLFKNILSVYLRLSKQKIDMPDKVLQKLIPLLFHEDFTIRNNTIWIFKHVVDHRTRIRADLIDAIEKCLQDNEFPIRNTSALILIEFWSKQIRLENSNRIESFLLTIFTKLFNLDVQRSSLKFLHAFVQKGFVLTERLIHLIECCLYDREETISKVSIEILHIASTHQSLLSTTLVCLEDLLTRETSILDQVILLLQSLTKKGEILSRKALDFLAQLLFKSSKPKPIEILLTHADRNQPLSRCIDELLRQIYYSQVLQHSKCSTTLNKAIEELLQATNQGKSLCVSLLDLLFRQIESNDQNQRFKLLPILVNVVANGQSITKNEYLSILEKIFFDRPSADLILILTHLTRQNQSFSDKILDKLKNYLNDSSMNVFIVEIYQHLIERQKPIDSSIIRTIFQTFFNEKRWKTFQPEFQFRLASFVKSIADIRSEEFVQDSVAFLLQSTEQTRVIKEILLSLQLCLERQNNFQIQSQIVDRLIILIENDQIDVELQNILFGILRRIRSTNKIIGDCLDFLQLNDEKDDRILLDKLIQIKNKQMNLSDVLITRLSHMIYSCDVELKTQAVGILMSNLSRGKTSSDKHLKDLTAALRDETINEKVLHFFVSRASEQPLPSSTINDLMELRRRSKDQSIQSLVEKILKEQMKFNSTKVETFVRYFQKKNEIEDIEDIEDVEELLKILRSMIIIDGELVVEPIREHFFGEKQNEFIELLLFAHRSSVSLNDHPALFGLIENALQQNPTDQLMELFAIAIKAKYSVTKRIQKMFFEKFRKDFHEKSLQMLNLIDQQKLLSDEMIGYFMECLVDPSRQPFVNDIFSILLRHPIDSMKLVEKIRLPEFVDRNQLKKLESVDKILHITQMLSFVNHLQPEVFEQSVEFWSRNSLAIELLINSTNKNQTEMIEFYQLLDEFEQFRNYSMVNEQRDLFLQQLILKQRQKSICLTTINEIFIFSQTKDDQPLEIVSSAHPNWFEQLRCHYVETQLIERCPQESKASIEHWSRLFADDQRFSSKFLRSLLGIFQSIEQIRLLFDLLELSILEKADFDKIFSSSAMPNDFPTLKNYIEMVIVEKTLKSNWIGSTQTFIQTGQILQTLIERQWSLKRILIILTETKQSKKTDDLFHLIDILKLLIDYEIPSNFLPSQLETILKENSIDLCSPLIYKHIIEHCFGSTSAEKNDETLLAELKNTNSQLEKEHLRTEYQKIEDQYKSFSSILWKNDPIESWSKSKIQSWAERVRQSTEKVKTSEMLAVIKRAVFLDSKFEPRPVQILAILILLETQNKHGRLLQVLTGEGKSTIVSMIAVIKVLQNNQVDIITSSITLAKRDAEERRPFYDYFKITVSHNNDETSYSSGPKACYRSDIVYGNSSQFQFDLLRHEFSLLNTRSLDEEHKTTRRFDFIIIDEVDSMLIDENNTLARLADQLPGMEWLNPLLFGIWRCVESQDDVCSKRDVIVDHMKQILSDSKTDLKVPQHLKDFVNESLPIWVDHALLAKVEYRLDHHYMIKSDDTRVKRIMPIDFSNTGVVQPTTIWSDGLHQFLQIKHGLKMTPLTITTNYLSNIGLFTRYGKNIFGLTGTIGSKKAQELLKRIYEVDTVIIPSFKEKRHRQMKPIITSDDDQWIKTIVSDTLATARKQRAILIICETRLDAKTISKQIQRVDPRFPVRLYTDNTDVVESNVVGNRIQPGEIIVATNLAGRGTDLKTSPSVEKNGGLHVCLTFLPANVRVEDQAFGRTSRQGQRGTSQMIISAQRTFQQLMNLHPDYLGPSTAKSIDPIEKIRLWRQEAETIQLNRMWTDEIQEIKQKDKLFRQFCQLLDELRKKKDDVYRLLSLKEQWGLWLKSMDVYILNRRRFRQTLAKQGFKCDDVTQDGHSFFHAVAKQLQGAMKSDEIKEHVIQHLIDQPNLYQDISDEERRHQATAESLNITLIVYRTDSNVPHIYQRENPIQTCFLGYEVNAYYFSLQNDSIMAEENQSASIKKQDKSAREKAFAFMKKFVDRAKEQQKDKLSKELATPIITDDFQRSFQSFADKMRKEFLEASFIRNPCYYFMEAETLIKQLSSWSNTAQSVFEYLPWTKKSSIGYKDVLDRLDKAIALDRTFTFSAQVTRAHFLIEQEQSNKLYKIQAKSLLKEAEEILGRFILPQLHSMQIETPKKTDDDELVYKDLMHQIHFRVEVLRMYQNHVSQAIATIEESQKFIDVSFIDDKHDPHRIHLHPNLYRDDVGKVLDAAQGKVSLTFHSLKSHKDLCTHDQAQDLLDLIEERGQQVSLHYFSGSIEKVKALEKIVKSEMIRLSIEYLDSNDLGPLIEQNHHADLQLTSTKEDLIIVIKAIIDEMTNRNGQREIRDMNHDLTLITKQHRRILPAREALRTLEDQNQTVEAILFKSINKTKVDFIVSHVKQPSFTLTYHSLTFDRFKQIIKDLKKPFSYEFRELSPRQGKTFIKKIVDREFRLLIEDISVSRAKKIIEKFDRKEQDVKSALKFMIENIPKEDQHQDELNAFAFLGVNLLINIDELGPRPWISVSVVCAAGILQIAGGIALTAVTCGLGVSLGISLIGEGVNDIIFGIRGAYSRRFSWKDYAIQKGISLTICIVSLGTSAVFQAVKGAQAVGVTGATMSATRQGTWAIIKNSFRMVPTGALGNISSTSWSLAFKQVIVTCAESGVRELANYLSDSAYQGLLSQVKEVIQEEIESNLRIHQSHKDYQRIFQRTSTIDRYYGNDHCRKQMEQIVMSILTKNQDQFLEAMESTSKGITNAFLNHSRQFVKETGNSSKVGTCITGAQLLMTIGPMIKGVQDIRTVTDLFFNQYLKELKVLEGKLPKFETLLVHASNEEMSSSVAQDIVQRLTENSILTSDGLLDPRFSRNVDPNETDFSNQGGYLESHTASARTPQQYLLNHLRKVTFDEENDRKHAETVLIKIINNQHQGKFSMSMFQKKIVDALTDRLCAILYGTMVAPMKNFIISQTIASLSTMIQLEIDPKGTVTEQLMQQGAKRYIHGVGNDFIEAHDSGEQTLDPNARKKIDQLLRETKQNPNRPLTANEQMAMNVLKGGQGGNIELIILALLTKKCIEVVDVNSPQQGNSDDGTIRVEYTPAWVDEESGRVMEGHYEMFDGTTVQGGPTDCLYTAVLSGAKGQYSSVKQLRKSVAGVLLTSPNFIAGIHPALSIINQARDPVHWKELMGQAGARNVPLPPVFLPKENVNTTQEATDKVIKDMEKYIKFNGKGVISEEAATDIINHIKDSNRGLGNFHRDNNREKNAVVEIELKFELTHRYSKEGETHQFIMSMNADSPEQYNPAFHFGCLMHLKEKSEPAQVTHKYLPNGVLQNTRPVGKSRGCVNETSSILNFRTQDNKYDVKVTRIVHTLP